MSVWKEEKRIEGMDNNRGNSIGSNAGIHAESNNEYGKRICEWTSEYSVGVTVLDSHHQKLFDIINDLFNLMDNDANDKKIIDTLAKLVEYTEYHFSEEEQVMAKMGYPQLAEHHKQHQDFTDTIKKFYQESQHSKAIFVALKVANMGLAWLKNHIQTVDHKYYEYMMERNVQ